MQRPVPWITQYASPSLIAGIAYGGHPRAEDPRWRETGAPDRETYAAWCARWCGMTCFQMALLARDGAAPTLYELAVGCMEYGGYADEPGRPRGLIGIIGHVGEIYFRNQAAQWRTASSHQQLAALAPLCVVSRATYARRGKGGTPGRLILFAVSSRERS
jgi:hypothetical protein